MLIFDALDRAYVFGLLMGWGTFYLFLLRPLMNLKDARITRLEKRLEERYK